MPVAIHRSERSDALVEGLAGLLRVLPADPFVPEVVAVPSKGVERWIAQTLSQVLGEPEGEGVCANVLFPSPSRLVREALATASGLIADTDPWVESRLVWSLLDVIDGCAGESWCRTLGRHLSGDVGRGRRVAVAQKLTRLFTSYAAERPDMVLSWAAGADTDGAGSVLERDLAWQPELWRRLRARVGVVSPAERLDASCRALRDDPGLLALPERLSFFGPTRLSTMELTVVDAIATGREVHLWLPSPSVGLWSRLREPGVAVTGPTTRRDDPTTGLAHHPLLRSLARDSRELQVRLDAELTVGSEEHLPVAEPPPTLLGTLQRDLRADRAPAGTHRLDPSDRSVEVHACHGRHRQVEVLREVLLGVLQETPDLELRDIIVMCPDIEAYAPLVAANFGATGVAVEDAGPAGPHPGHGLTFRMADRSLQQTNPLLAVGAKLLALADSRCTASDVVDLAAMGPVRRRFGFDDPDVEKLADWARRAGVRWGLDTTTRAEFGLEAIDQNTWAHGVDRLLAGVMMDEEGLGLVGHALPLDDIDSGAIDLVGRVAELLDRVAGALGELRVEQSIAAWASAFGAGLASLAEVANDEAWQSAAVEEMLARLVASAAADPNGLLRLSDVRALLAEELQGRPTRANFRTGHLTVCTMVPMRSVPHRVVCLLGVDDGVFPRGQRLDGDDILARSPRLGERDVRSEDRQLFLDAILAAQERLVILYTGADERTGAVRPPAVPLGELLDVLDSTATLAEGPARRRVVVEHPLQPFDERNFIPGGLVADQSFSFDSAAYAGSSALRGVRQPRAPFLSGPLPAVPQSDTLDLEQLIRFWEHPVRGFLQQRLEVRTADEEDPPDEDVPVALDPLLKWAVGDRMLKAALRGVPPERAVRAERLRGTLPPGALGRAVGEPILSEVHALVGRTQALVATEARSLDVSVALPDLTLVGTVPGVHLASAGGGRVVRVEYSRLRPKHRLRAWIQLLALAAAHPGPDWQSVVAGRGGKDQPVAGSFLVSAAPDEAVEHLTRLVALRRLGLRFPLPAPPDTACEYAARRQRLSPDVSATYAANKWLTRAKSGAVWGEYDDGDYRRVGLTSFEDLLVRPVQAAGGLLDAGDEPHLFGRLATAVWQPLLAKERLA